ncbi:hypothetical protein BDP27DRAFT_1416117 [Rhodocollybia butyracea]|uniref:Uncharacterized protein n=1 Tax=Rhodocollybia butyracea TaxID=206335 RepID=A0A9P5Q4W2_9AGAR|nr:hypothetical protein BDP27DRAFT_1416117 [Rhodocollybia butyracea]
MALCKYLIPPPIPMATLNHLQRFMPMNVHHSAYGSQIFLFAALPLPQSNILSLPPPKPLQVSPVELTMSTSSETVPSQHPPDVPVAIVAISGSYAYNSSSQVLSQPQLKEDWPRRLYTYEMAAGFQLMATEELKTKFNSLSSCFANIFGFRLTDLMAEAFMAHKALWNSLSQVEQANGICKLGPNCTGLWSEYLNALGYEA